MFWDPVGAICQEQNQTGRTVGIAAYGYSTWDTSCICLPNMRVALLWEVSVLILAIVALRGQANTCTSACMYTRWQRLYYVMISIVANTALMASHIQREILPLSHVGVVLRTIRSQW